MILYNNQGFHVVPGGRCILNRGLYNVDIIFHQVVWGIKSLAETSHGINVQTDLDFPGLTLAQYVCKFVHIWTFQTCWTLLMNSVEHSVYHTFMCGEIQTSRCEPLYRK